jgi:hypothetical protein
MAAASRVNKEVDVEMRRRMSPFKHAFVPKMEKRVAEIFVPIRILATIPLMVKIL